MCNLNIRTACVSACVLRTLACRGSETARRHKKTALLGGGGGDGGWGQRGKSSKNAVFVGKFSTINIESANFIVEKFCCHCTGSYSEGRERHLNAAREKCCETISAAQLPRNYPHRGGNLERGKMPFLAGRVNLGGILRDDLGEGNCESKTAARQWGANFCLAHSGPDLSYVVGNSACRGCLQEDYPGHKFFGVVGGDLVGGCAGPGHNAFSRGALTMQSPRITFRHSALAEGQQQ